MAILNDDQSKELCRKIEQYILKDGYFIFDADDWDNLHIEYRPYVYGKNLEHVDYTKITVTLDGYNITDTFRVQYYFARNTLFSKQLGDSYTVYYTDKGVDHTGNDGQGTSLDEAADFIANRFIGLVEDKIMNKKLEERILRLERLLYRKDELFGFGKLTSADEKGFINKLFSKYPSLLDIFGNYSPSSSKKTFHIVLTAPKGKPYNGTSFVISTKGGRKEVYVNATDKYNTTLGVIRNLNIDTDINKIASFILNTLSNTATESRVIQRRRRKNEGVPLTTFDCENVEQIIRDSFDDLPEIDIDITDDNSDYGFLNIGIYNPEYVTDYDMIVNEAESVDVEHEGKKIGTAESIEDAADLLAEHFMKEYITDGKYKK